MRSYWHISNRKGLINKQIHLNSLRLPSSNKPRGLSFWDPWAYAVVADFSTEQRYLAQAQARHLSQFFIYRFMSNHVATLLCKIWLFGFILEYICTFYYTVVLDIIYIDTTGFLFQNLYFKKILVSLSSLWKY